MERKRDLLNRQQMPAGAPSDLAIQGQIANLELERERLEEEVSQLQAAVEIYTELARRWASDVRQQDSPDNARSGLNAVGYLPEETRRQKPALSEPPAKGE